MSLLRNLLRITGPTLPPGWCPTDGDTWQTIFNKAFGGARVTFLVESGSFLYNLGSTTPDPDDRIYPWYNTQFNRWYNHANGWWLARHPVPAGPNGYRQLWMGSNDGAAGGLWLFDEGEGTDPFGVGNVNDILGSFWSVDPAFEGRVPIGAGTVPGASDPTITVSVGSTGGAARHTLTDAEGGVGQHTHPFGLTNLDGGSSADDGFFAKSAVTAVPSYQGFLVTGGGSPTINSFTQANLYTLPSNDGEGGDADPFDILPPYIGAHFIQRTRRIYYRLPE